jgi:NAD dependent epimerase/dehydratase family enzyme
VSPKPIDNRGFMRTMGRVLRRPVFLPMPAPVVRTLFGRMGQEALLDGAFVLPSRLVELGFRYDFPELDDALHFELGIFR